MGFKRPLVQFQSPRPSKKPTAIEAVGFFIYWCKLAKKRIVGNLLVIGFINYLRYSSKSLYQHGYNVLSFHTMRDL